MTEGQMQIFMGLVADMRTWQQVHATTGSPEARVRAQEGEVLVDHALDGLQQQGPGARRQAMSPRDAMQIADALLSATVDCPCDQPGGVPLCPSCACLLSLMCAVLNWQARQLAPGATYVSALE
jgi:hypothetical protein